jgi:hypothetical protein
MLTKFRGSGGYPRWSHGLACGALLAGLLIEGTASARDRRFELGASAGYLVGGSAEGTSGTVTSQASIDSAPSYGGWLDVMVRPNAYAEISYTRQQTGLLLHQSDDTNYRYDMTAQYIHIGGLLELHPPDNDWFRPIFGGTMGATVFTSNSDGFSYDEWRFSLAFEGGAKIKITDFVGIRARARLLMTFLTDESALICGNSGNCLFAYSGTAVFQGEFGGGVYVAF